MGILSIEAFFVCLSIFSSVSIVAVNRRMFLYEEFQYHDLLLFFHTMATWLYAKLIRNRFGDKTQNGEDLPGTPSKPKSPVYRPIVNATLLGMSILFMNLTLSETTISFYQMVKLLLIPVQTAVDVTLLGVSHARETFASLALLCVGLAFVFAIDLHATISGVLFSFGAILFTTSGQSMVQLSRRSYSDSPLDMVETQSFWQMCLFLVISLRNVVGFMESMHTFPIGLWVCLIGSSFLAFMVNLCSFFIIGKLSALTYVFHPRFHDVKLIMMDDVELCAFLLDSQWFSIE
eukprot:TRINITY_DN1621_c0_g1_i1.p1 TRINITY_DN1621_c0_g1~~TRINITY_DN1621_c0_g1_i1.p1  ORF type:complete len:313 (-),score=55.76 TRINITY_DN1621_c0_g1_i1:278-1147(-)